MSANKDETAQQRFDRTYISSSEICRRVGVSRTTLLSARRRGLLPDSIAVADGAMYVWERAAVEPNLEAWGRLLNIRREHHYRATATA